MNYRILSLGLSRFAFLLCLALWITPTSAQWVKNNDIKAGKVNAVIYTGTRLVAGTDTGGVYISNNDGVNWTVSNQGLSNHNVADFIMNGGKLIAAIGSGLSGAIFISQDHGSTWTPSASNYYGFLFCLTSYQNNVLAGSWYGVIKSTDAGSSWATLSTTGLPSNASVSALETDGNIIYAGVEYSSSGGTGIFSSANGGASWSAKNTGLTNMDIRSLALNGSTILAGTAGGGIFISTNAGTSWTASNNGLSNLVVNCLRVIGSTIFAGTDDGVFKSLDNGASWTSVSTGLLTGESVYDIYYSSNTMFLSTKSGLWTRPSSQVGINIAAKPVSDIALKGQSGSKYSFYLPFYSEVVNCSIYDMKGRLVQDLKIASGTENLEIDLGRNTRGIYSVVFANDIIQRTIKIIRD
jgi:photosystem II stability/assembly factor-like uncharacterized protein